jgi:hypothetical protein
MPYRHEIQREPYRTTFQEHRIVGVGDEAATAARPKVAALAGITVLADGIRRCR